MSLALTIFGLVLSFFLTVRYAKGQGVLSFIFLFSAVHALYIFPKVLALVLADTPAGQYFRESGATITVSFMALTCYLAALGAYGLAKRKMSGEWTASTMVDERTALRFSVVVGGLGILAFLALAARSGGLVNYYRHLDFYEMGFSGINVWLIFVSRFVYPALVVAALVFVIRPTKKLWLGLLGGLILFPVLNVVFLLRRTDLIFVGFIALYALVVSGRLRIWRAATLAIMVGLASLVLLFPSLRQDSMTKVTGESYSTQDMSLGARIIDTVAVDDDDEIVRAASTIDDISRHRSYQYGAFLWDSLVDQFVPSTLVGTDAKASLYLGRARTEESAASYFDDEAYFYVAPMGFAQAYGQFGVLGSLIFAILGVMIAAIERRSAEPADLVFLILAIPLVAIAATNDISSMPARLLTFWAVTRLLGLLMRHARARTYTAAPPRGMHRSR